MYVDKDEDLLPYLCSVAERIMFGRKMNERVDNICAPKKDSIALARQKLISAFVQFF